MSLTLAGCDLLRSAKARPEKLWFTSGTRDRAREEGFILMAAMAMLTVMLGVVLLCFYPQAYEARQDPRHREALRRFKIAEQGIFGSLADRAGGENSACGGYFSDTGMKMVVAELVPEYVDGNLPMLRRAMEFWYFRRCSDVPVLTNIKPDGRPDGCNDIYRYDLENGFWVGYRGKRYIVRPIGEEHLRRDFGPGGNFANRFPDIPYFTDGSDGGFLELEGKENVTSFYLSGYYNACYAYSQYEEQAIRNQEHRRYFNPVEKLVIRLNDRRISRTLLSAILVYAKQPDGTPVDDARDLLPSLSPIVVSESPDSTIRSGAVTTFVFEWEPGTETTEDYTDPGVYRGHTFEIGLKKLVLLEGDPPLPVFACGITIPPVRDYQCRAVDMRVDYCTGCGQIYYDQYVIEMNYDG